MDSWRSLQRINTQLLQIIAHYSFNCTLPLIQHPNSQMFLFSKHWHALANFTQTYIANDVLNELNSWIIRSLISSQIRYELLLPSTYHASRAACRADTFFPFLFTIVVVGKKTWKPKPFQSCSGMPNQLRVPNINMSSETVVIGIQTLATCKNPHCIFIVEHIALWLQLR